MVHRLPHRQKTDIHKTIVNPIKEKNVALRAKAYG